MRRLELKIPPVVVFLAVAAAMWGVARMVPEAGVPVAGARVLSLLLVIVAGSLTVTAILQFRRHETTVHPGNPEKASTIVTNGVYRYTRNPMYLGLACLLAAWAAWLGNFAALLGLPIFIVYMTRFQIRPEERALRELFGDDYHKYRQGVRRWL